MFLGAGVGGVLRYLVTVGTIALFGPSLPVGTVSVNVIGSFLMGAVSHYLLTRSGGDALLRLFMVTGVLGGFTTFSAFSSDLVALHQRGHTPIAILYGVISVFLSVIALVLGGTLVRLFLEGSNPG